MGDLFSETEATLDSKKKTVYKAKDGKFTDKVTAKITQAENDRDRYKKCSEYWSRQAERLSDEYKAEHKKVLELQEQIKKLTECVYDPTTSRKSREMATS